MFLHPAKQKTSTIVISTSESVLYFMQIVITDYKT